MPAFKWKARNKKRKIVHVYTHLLFIVTNKTLKMRFVCIRSMQNKFSSLIGLWSYFDSVCVFYLRSTQSIRSKKTYCFFFCFVLLSVSSFYLLCFCYIRSCAVYVCVRAFCGAIGVIRIKQFSSICSTRFVMCFTRPKWLRSRRGKRNETNAFVFLSLISCCIVQFKVVFYDDIMACHLLYTFRTIRSKSKLNKLIFLTDKLVTKEWKKISNNIIKLYANTISADVIETSTVFSRCYFI